jgi:hypothetical protein
MVMQAAQLPGAWRVECRLWEWEVSKKHHRRLHQQEGRSLRRRCPSRGCRTLEHREQGQAWVMEPGTEMGMGCKVGRIREASFWCDTLTEIHEMTWQTTNCMRCPYGSGLEPGHVAHTQAGRETKRLESMNESSGHVTMDNDGWIRKGTCQDFV